MNLLNDQITGFIMLLLLASLVAAKRIATGSTIDLPGGTPAVRLINTFNLFFLLIIIPGTSLLLIAGQLEAADPSRIGTPDPWLQPLVVMVGWLIYLGGHALMSLALMYLGRNYQTGGMPPRTGDEIVMRGPFRVIRHPVYAAALCIALGLAVLTQSGILFGVFGIYFVLILFLIDIEEQDLRRVYSEKYSVYCQKVKRLIPFVY